VVSTSFDGREWDIDSSNRPDVIGHQGFIARAPFRPSSSREAGSVSAYCENHPRLRVSREVSSVDWNVSTIGTINSAVWPEVMGWAVTLSGDIPGTLSLTIGDLSPVKIVNISSRADVRNHLGTTGVKAFTIDLRDVSAFALADSPYLGLSWNGECIAESTLVRAQRYPTETNCGASLDFSMFAHRGIDLSRHLRKSVTEKNQDSSVNPDRDLGLPDFSPEGNTWRDALTQQGFDSDVIAGWLALKMISANATEFIDPLPTTLSEKLQGLMDQNDRTSVSEKTVLDALIDYTGRKISTGVKVNSLETKKLVLDYGEGKPPLHKVCVAGLVGHPSGIGQNADTSVQALKLSGIHVCAAPFFPERGGWNRRLGLVDGRVGDLSDHSILLHVPIDRMVETLAIQPGLSSSDRLIGYFMWETEGIPRELHRGLALVDEIWTASTFVAEQIRRVCTTPVRITGHSVDVSDVRQIDRRSLGISGDAFVTHFAFDANSTVARKNPNGAIDAFEAAFGTDPTAIFLLKIRNFQQVTYLARQGCPNALGLLNRIERLPNIIVIDSEWDRPSTLGLIQLADCFISLHRSEGFGYALAEALLLGTPLIAPDYSGPQDFLTPDNSYLVDAKPLEVRPGEYFYWQPDMAWSDPNIDQAAEHLWRIKESAKPKLSDRDNEFPEFSMNTLAMNFNRLLQVH
jgi:hypothetical protein